MSKNQEFDYGRVPAVLYHGASRSLRSSIESKGLTGGHVTEHVDLAAEYATPDLYEVRKHPSVVDPNSPDNRGNEWDLNSGVYWANGVPASHVTRVGHVIGHLNSDGEYENNEVHWHRKEDCHLDYDMTHPKDMDQFFWYGKNIRQHPTNPNLNVSDYNG
jgi:hypothetical protein